MKQMAWENEKKSESYTFRMKPPVWDTIQEYEGEGRNEKLENLVYFAFSERYVIQREIDDLEAKRERLKNEIEQYNQLVSKLQRVQWGVKDLLRIADGIEREENE